VVTPKLKKQTKKKKSKKIPGSITITEEKSINNTAQALCVFFGTSNSFDEKEQIKKTWNLLEHHSKRLQSRAACLAVLAINWPQPRILRPQRGLST
jgi:hypothetical protein